MSTTDAAADQENTSLTPEKSAETSSEPGLSLAEQAYDAIVDLILTYRLRLGERTSVAQLAKRLDLGRTPVKEAISRLESEGLLTVSGRSGTTVKQIDAQTARQLFALRRHLEAFAVAEAVKNIDDEKLGKLRVLLDQLHWPADNGPGQFLTAANYVRSNVKFHAAIVACAANPILDRLYGQLQLQTQIVIYLYHMTRSIKGKIIEAKYQEHAEIYQALQERDANKLGALLDQHAATTEKSVIESLSMLRRGNAGTY